MAAGVIGLAEQWAAAASAPCPSVEALAARLAPRALDILPGEDGFEIAFEDEGGLFAEAEVRASVTAAGALAWVDVV